MRAVLAQTFQANIFPLSMSFDASKSLDKASAQRVFRQLVLICLRLNYWLTWLACMDIRNFVEEAR